MVVSIVTGLLKLKSPLNVNFNMALLSEGMSERILDDISRHIC
jgi:hypothetical protein